LKLQEKVASKTEIVALLTSYIRTQFKKLPKPEKKIVKLQKVD